MHRLRLSRRGQFTIIAAMLIAVVLIAAVMTTYSAIRYTEFEEQPRILSAVDEINLALKHVLGFTVGYYGSVLQVTGNTTYAKELALNYLRSGLENIGDIRPEWSPSFSITDFDLRTYWFTNASYSSGYFSVNYDLNGLGIYGMTYSTSCRLDVEVLPSSGNQAHIRITKDDGEPVINLGKQSLKFYRYRYSNLTWEHVSPSEEPRIYADGTYEITVPPEIDPAAYVIRVEDSRGIIVVAAAFSQYIINLDWNSPNATQTPYYVEGITEVMGDSLNFTAQQNTDDIFDMLTEAASGTAPQNYYPDYWKGLGSTTYESGTIADLQSDNGQYMQLHSTIGYSYIGSSTQNIENNIVGSQFNVLGDGEVQSITAYIDLSSGASNRKVKAAIYTSSHSFVAGTQEQTVNSDGWVTFNFPDPKPILTAGASYILVVWADSKSGSVSVPYDIGSSNQGHYVNRTYGSWPSSPSFTHENRKYSIYCTYSPVGQHACEVEFTGIADTQNWTQLTWTVDARSTTSDVNLTLQLYNFATGQYSTSGEGFMTDTVGNTTDLLKTQTITVNPTDFRNSSGYWKIKITAVKSTSTPFYMKFDLVRFSPYVTNYALELEEQWANVNATNPRYDLCIKTGTLGSEPLKVEVRSGSSWVPIINALQPNIWNNVSVTQYISSPTFTIRLKGGNDNTDPTQDNWYIDAVLLKPKPDPSFLLATLEESTIVVELLQNGTMRWLGQALINTTQTLPIPPIPVKAIHVNQTRNGVEKEVPFQVEDWASEYRIPQGLTNNATVFSNRQMIVFLVDVHVTKITIWWNGSDEAIQTPLAYTNFYFSDNTDNRTLNNGRVRLQVTSSGFNINSTVGSVNSTANLMRINNKIDTTLPEWAWVIVNGVVRSIIQGEAEWKDGGIPNCPNVYSNIVITLPANVTYYTYQLRLMFINSTISRTIWDLCPIQLSTNLGSIQMMTENGTANGFPIVNSTGVFYNYNYTSGGWTAHHWSQIITGTKGSGIMFTDNANQQLYAFDAIGPSAGTPTGALNVTATTNGLIQLQPVTIRQVQFQDARDFTWHGAVVTFDGTTPIYRSSDESGLWLLVEYPPAITVTTTG
ncbi:MAG: hypothetical protein ACPLIG_02985 [Candidatus Bathyarchaeales archaeon]